MPRKLISELNFHRLVDLVDTIDEALTPNDIGHKLSDYSSISRVLLASH
jgi:hypothetical protein